MTTRSSTLSLFVALATISIACVDRDDELPGVDQTVDNRSYSLSEASPLRTEVSIRQAVDTDTLRIDATLNHGLQLARDYSETCPTFPGLVRALVDSVVYPIEQRGGWTLGLSPRCLTPTFVTLLQPSAAKDPTFVLADAGTTIAVPLGTFLQRRSGALVSPPPGGYRRGDTVTVRWSHASDLDDALPEVRIVGNASIAVPPASITRVNDLLSFPLPNTVAGTTVIEIKETGETTAICTGTCVIKSEHTVAVPVTLLSS